MSGNENENIQRSIDEGDFFARRDIRRTTLKVWFLICIILIIMTCSVVWNILDDDERTEASVFQVSVPISTMASIIFLVTLMYVFNDVSTITDW